MQSTQLVCPHCNSTLTFGVAISPAAAVECLICMKRFTANNPVAVAVTAKPTVKPTAAKVNAKPAPTTFAAAPMAAAKPAKVRKQKPPVRRPVDADSKFLMIAVSIAIVLLVTGGISFAVWKSMRATQLGPIDPEDDKIAKNGDPKTPEGKTPLPAEDKKPESGGGKALATLSYEDERDLRAKFQQEMKERLTRKAPTLIPGKEPDWEVKAPPLATNTVAGLDQPKINAAIARGIAYLKRAQAADGGWGGGGYEVGYASLCGLTLLECKVPAGDLAVQRAAAFVRRRCAKINTNYQASLAVLFLDRLRNPSDRAIIQGLALQIMAAQDDAGGWTYGTPILSPEESCQLFAYLRPNTPLHKPAANLQVLNPNDPFQRLRFLLLSKGLDTESSEAEAKDSKLKAPPVMPLEGLDAKLRNLQVVRNRGKRKGEIVVVQNTSSDNSNTQFALLALWAARRHGVPTEPALLAGYQRFTTTQNPTDHGWGYGGPGASTNTMTCIGLIGLGIGHGTARDSGKAGAARPVLQDGSVQAGLQALARNIGQPSTDAKKTSFPRENHYFLWSVERVAMLYDLDTIGGKDWYGWVAQILIHNQLADGAWQSAPFNGSDPRVDTCFALLFLRRSNLVQDLTRNLRSAVREP